MNMHLGNMPKREVVREVDNRDTNTTWLWLVTARGRPRFVEIDPIELFVNMLDNLDPEQKDEVIERVLLELGCMGNKE